jgi:hypothetical protein
MTGWNEDEGFVFGKPKNAVEFRKSLSEKFGKTPLRL